MHKLEQYFKGEQNWNDFVELYDEFWNGSSEQLKLLEALNGNLSVAKVIFGQMGDSSLKWIHERVPALDGLSPVECLQSQELMKRLKVCLKRMP